MEPEYGRLYGDLYRRHWWWRVREEAVLRVIRRHVSPNARQRILDVGCGDGLFFDRLAEIGYVEGVEPDERLVDPLGPHRERILVAPFDANISCPTPYSLVLMLDVLEHLDHPAEALRHAHSLLAPGGGLLITVPAFQILWTNHDAINHHHVRYRRSTLFPLLRQAGFDLREDRYWFQWTFPVRLGIRVFEKILRRPSATERVPPVWINRSLYWISCAEQRALGAIGMPFGTTLMVYCTKQDAPLGDLT